MDRTAFLLRELYEHPGCTQRTLAKALSLSLGSINKLLVSASEEGLIDPASNTVTEKGLRYLEPFRMDGAVIMAAGFGSRFVPLTYELPKGLLKVKGERMIERQIRQLHEAGITDITIVVGYLKEKFDYLIDRFGVKLLYNPDFAEKNNLSTVYYARHLLKGRNMYLLSSDNWMRNNLYHLYEPGAWYSSVFAEGETKEWCLKCSRKDEIIDVKIGGKDDWVMYGPVCMTREFSEVFLPAAEEAFHTPGKEQYYWENVYIDLLRSGNKAMHPVMHINRRPADEVYEFENLEELREFDSYYRDHSDNAAMELISRVFKLPQSEITGIRCLKAGMTNHSFLFEIDGKGYICRIPGEGTEMLISRSEEYENYQAVKDLDISEHVVYFDPETGYKISAYYDGSRNADPDSPADMKRCMELVRKLHASGVSVPHDFDVAERIRFYESLCQQHGGIPFEDYDEVKAKMEALLSALSKLDRPKVLAHIDSVAANFLFIPDDAASAPASAGPAASCPDQPSLCNTEGGCADDASASRESIRLIDWEYSGMADPLIDIAMCAIYSYYTRKQAEALAGFYFGRSAAPEELAVIFSYMALGGFLWALWAVYKANLGVTFGDYTLVMYRYAKDGFRWAAEQFPELKAALS